MSLGAVQTDSKWKLLYEMVSFQLSLGIKSKSFPLRIKNYIIHGKLRTQ